MACIARAWGILFISLPRKQPPGNSPRQQGRQKAETFSKFEWPERPTADTFINLQSPEVRKAETLIKFQGAEAPKDRAFIKCRRSVAREAETFIKFQRPEAPKAETVIIFEGA